MRELFLASSDSTPSSLVFRTGDGEEFFLEVTDDLRGIFSHDTAGDNSGNQSGDGAEPAADTRPEQAERPLSAVQRNEQDAHHSSEAEQPQAATAAEDVTEQTAAADSSGAAGSIDSVKPAQAADAVTASSASRVERPAEPSHRGGHSLHGKRQEREQVKVRPNEIQNRVRAGASAQELAEEMGVSESRIEPFAYPVMLERSRIAEVAKQAHPVREDGPATLTLWEILATAFAARGHSLSESTWDAYRNQGEPWVVRVSWKAGLSLNEAEWTFKQSMSTPATVEARNSVAADLTDPDFVQPVRSLTSVSRGGRYDEAIDGEGSAAGVTDITDLTAPTTAPESSGDEDARSKKGAKPAGSSKGSQSDGEIGSEADEDFLQNPDPKPTKRRRKAVTPHWEDVLLGVRSNTKRPRD